MFAFVSTVTTVSNNPVSNGGSVLVVIINFSTPLSPSCEEGVLNPLPSPNGGHKISAITLMGTTPDVILSKVE